MEWIKIIISATALIFIAVIVYKSVFAGIFHRREPNMYVIVGLGNPGREYADTKHNVGFMVIDKLADQYNIDVTKFKHKAFVGDGIISGKKVMLVKPQTYMNLSGESVKEIMSFYKVPTENMIVIYDDTSLETGLIRLREKGSAGREAAEDLLKYSQLPMTILWESVSTQSLVRAVSRNIGISALPCLLAEDALAQGIVAQIPFDAPALHRSFSIIYHQNKYLTENALRFMEMCRRC